jgi:hypothetical protein
VVVVMQDLVFCLVGHVSSVESLSRDLSYLTEWGRKYSREAFGI